MITFIQYKKHFFFVASDFSYIGQVRAYERDVTLVLFILGTSPLEALYLASLRRRM
jgi:hypothetical protein